MQGRSSRNSSRVAQLHNSSSRSGGGRIGRARRSTSARRRRRARARRGISRWWRAASRACSAAPLRRLSCSRPSSFAGGARCGCSPATRRSGPLRLCRLRPRPRSPRAPRARSRFLTPREAHQRAMSPWEVPWECLGPSAPVLEALRLPAARAWCRRPSSPAPGSCQQRHEAQRHDQREGEVLEVRRAHAAAGRLSRARSMVATECSSCASPAGLPRCSSASISTAAMT